MLSLLAACAGGKQGAEPQPGERARQAPGVVPPDTAETAAPSTEPDPLTGDPTRGPDIAQAAPTDGGIRDAGIRDAGGGGGGRDAGVRGGGDAGVAPAPGRGSPPSPTGPTRPSSPTSPTSPMVPTR
ncbi:MAG TPA: hypothetical protein VK932_15395 [Kofleriaceae bacterium]|nr:hypothetical protein [Kofleriaceae bacterium]